MSSLARRWRANRLCPRVEAEGSLYAQGARRLDRGGVALWQLRRFNALWQQLSRRVPHFALLKEERRLPEIFDSWAEVRAGVPTMDRSTLQAKGDSLLDPSREPDALLATGGSTAEPIQVPKWQSEADVSGVDMWWARSWFGVTPADRLFLLWGHSHLLGGGLRGPCNRARRRLKDGLMGYVRCSAYDLSREAMRSAGERLFRHRPSCVLGYSVALERFALFNADRRRQLHELKLRVAVATGESFSRDDGAELVSETLGCPTAMEYGTVETGPVAHQAPSGSFKIFWRHFHVEVEPGPEGAGELILTALYPRSLPLLRYRLGDRVVLADEAEDDGAVGRLQETVLEVARVVGRSNDYLLCTDGTPIHSEAFTHAVRDEEQVSGFQFRQASPGEIDLLYLSQDGLDWHGEERVRRRLGRVHPELAGVRLRRVGVLQQTLAGKTPSIVRAGGSA